MASSELALTSVDVSMAFHDFLLDTIQQFMNACSAEKELRTKPSAIDYYNAIRKTGPRTRQVSQLVKCADEAIQRAVVASRRTMMLHRSVNCIANILLVYMGLRPAFLCGVMGDEIRIILDMAKKIGLTCTSLVYEKSGNSPLFIGDDEVEPDVLVTRGEIDPIEVTLTLDRNRTIGRLLGYEMYDTFLNGETPTFSVHTKCYLKDSPLKKFELFAEVGPMRRYDAVVEKYIEKMDVWNRAFEEMGFAFRTTFEIRVR